ncbi:MAG: hypothetical protein GC154_18220 [bacterium]|nr:hypothetical protein [bacterium]
MSRFIIPSCLILSLIVFATTTSFAQPTVQSFEGGAGDTPYEFTQYGVNFADPVTDGGLRLLQRTSERNVAAFELTAPGPHRRIIADWTLDVRASHEGLAFALLSTSEFGVSGAGPDAQWDEPNLTGSLAFGFDFYDENDIYNNNQAEVSLHWNGVERDNRRSAVDFRNGAPHLFHAEIEFAPSGALIDLTIDGEAVYDRFFLAGVEAYECRAAFGGVSRTGSSNSAVLDDVRVEFESPAQPIAPDATVNVFDRMYVYASNRNPSVTMTMPEDETVYERVLMKVTLSEPDDGYDYWDRSAAVYLAKGRDKYEIARYITPYRVGGAWWFDVTDFQSLMHGRVVFGLFIDTWVGPGHAQGSGWDVSVDLMFYRGEPEYVPYQVVNVWNGEPRYGDPSNPISNFFTPKVIDAASETAKAKLRIVTTGHGQSPNAQNAAEFIMKGRTVSVNGIEYRNILWRTDCYMNPVRPQFGTWVYSRAGWCPGDQVEPWEIDITDDITPGDAFLLEYAADPYTNTSIDQGNPARHWVASQVIFYRKAQTSSAAHWEDLSAAGGARADR